MSDLVGNPEDWFSCVAAHYWLIPRKSWFRADMTEKLLIGTKPNHITGAQWIMFFFFSFIVSLM